jgi:2-polyprenyl-6-methoxyphenol hydroxylase-like FAD-dependent oxidoreductase
MTDSMTSSSPQTVAIVGGGPVGALASLYFAKYFSKVTLYELRAGAVSLDLPRLIL